MGADFDSEEADGVRQVKEGDATLRPKAGPSHRATQSDALVAYAAAPPPPAEKPEAKSEGTMQQAMESTGKGKQGTKLIHVTLADQVR